MKKIVVLCLLLLLVGCETESEIISHELPSIKELEIRHYDIETEGLTRYKGNAYIKEIQRFDRAGTLIEKETYDIHGNLHYQYSYKYFENNLIEENKYNALIKENTKTIMVYTDGKITKKELYSNDQLFRYEVTEYINDKDFTTLVYDASDKVKTWISIIYQSDLGKESESIHYDEMGNQWLSSFAVYNDFGNLIRQEANGQDSTTIVNSIFDDQGNEVETEIIKDGEVTMHVVNRFDEHNNKIRMFDAETLQELYAAEYDYDEHGNILLIESYSEGSLLRSEERMIIYHDN